MKNSLLFIIPKGDQMKKLLFVILAAFLVVSLVLAGATKSASAIGHPSLTIAAGDWSTGTSTVVDFGENPIPDWMMSLTNPVKISEPGMVCHDFRGGQFGWVGQIRQLVDGKWVEVESTVGWVPNTEGKFMICADVQSGGTFGLFGFFNPPLSYYPDYVEPSESSNESEPF